MVIMGNLIKSTNVASAAWKTGRTKRIDIIWHITEFYREMKEIKEESFGLEEFAYSGSSRTQRISVLQCSSDGKDKEETVKNDKIRRLPSGNSNNSNEEALVRII